MTWLEFIGYVNEDLGVEAVRRGTENLRARALRESVIDLQRYIRAYRQGHTTTYAEANLTGLGDANLGSLPAGAIAKAFYIYAIADSEHHFHHRNHDPNVDRYNLDFFDWDKRKMLIAGAVPRGRYLYAIDPFGRKFLTVPKVNDATRLLLVWDGLKMDFEDTDDVPFPEQAAEACAEFILERLRRLIDKNQGLSQASMAAYKIRRRDLFFEEREKLSAEGQDEEYSEAVAPPS